MGQADDFKEPPPEAPIETTKGMFEKVSVSGLFGGTTPDKEKPAFKSKKFVAFLFVEVLMTMLAAMIIYQQDIEKLGGNFAFMTLIVTIGFIAVGYILGQAALDRYVRVAKIQQGLHSGEHPSEGDTEGDAGGSVG